jgi:hypothetical protein
MAPMPVHYLNAGTVRQGDDFERGKCASGQNVGGQGFDTGFVFVIQVAEVETLLHADIGIPDFIASARLMVPSLIIVLNDAGYAFMWLPRKFRIAH